MTGIKGAAAEMEKKNSDSKRFVVLFKEKIKIPENKWIQTEHEEDFPLEWIVKQNGNIIKRIHRLNDGNFWDYDLWFNKNFPGIHQISISDFETLLKHNYNYIKQIRNKILAREKNVVNIKSAQLVEDWLEKFRGEGDLKLYFHKTVSEGILEFRNGSKRAYLPEGYAAETILTFGDKFLKLTEVRKLVKQLQAINNFNNDREQR